MDKAQQRMNIVFMGTPPFAATILEGLMGWEHAHVSAVYCQPDRPAGRGHSLTSCAVKVLAESHSIPVYQPQNFKNLADQQALAALKPDFLVVAAYGLLLPQTVLDIPQYAPLNIHGSILPAYRGAAPIQRAVWDNCPQTGVSLMRMEAGLDTGPVYAVSTMPIGEHTSGSLHDALALLGTELLLQSLAAIAAGECRPVAQNNSLATHAPKLVKSDGRINFEASGSQVHAQVRAVIPWPGAQAVFSLPERPLLDVSITPGLFVPQKPLSAPCGALWHFKTGCWGIVLADGVYEVSSVRPAGKKLMSAQAFAQGYFPKGVAGHWGRALSLAEIDQGV